MPRLNPGDVRLEFPIHDLLPGWFFTCREQSNNVYRGEGSDLFGRRVGSVGTNYQHVLKECVTQAEAIDTQLRL